MGRTALQERRATTDTTYVSRVVASSLAALLAVGGLAVSVPHAAVARPAQACPTAGNLINGNTVWNHHHLAPGVTLSAATLRSGPRRLRVNVVRANLGRRRVAVAPLHGALTRRHRLSALARQPHLVAATNGMYFSFAFGSPTVPLIGARGPLVLSAEHQTVAGIGDDGLARDGRAWLQGSATAPEVGADRLVGINEVEPIPGLSLYTSAWGHHRVPRQPFSRALVVRHGHAVAHTSRHHRVPTHGVLLVASSLGSLGWMGSLRHNSPVDLNYRAVTNTHHPFRQAYGVGTRVVSSADHVRSGLYCNHAEVYAARTDIAWAKHHTQLILATVASPNSGEHYGLDEDQMSEVMVDLGVDRSYALDGGGSTDLVARLGGGPLSIRSPLPKGKERPIPVGVGVFSLPKALIKKEHRHDHPKHGHHPARPTGGKHCLLGVLLCHN
jgi:hypothetical protein